MGFIAQRPLNSEPGDNFITMTPGVQLAEGGDSMGQQYNTPRKIIGEKGCDVMIVGRGIYGAKPGKRREVAGIYRREGWAAYEERVRAGRRR
jgi:uridine monophosphate synthetase